MPTKKDRKNLTTATPTGSELERQYVELMQFLAPNVPSIARRESMWSSMMPRVVPSVTTYGAYEEPI